MSEAVGDWLDIFDDVVYSLMVFEIVLNGETEEFGLVVLFKECIIYSEFDWLCMFGVKNGVVGFCWVGDEIVIVKVRDKVGEF